MPEPAQDNPTREFIESFVSDRKRQFWVRGEGNDERPQEENARG